VIAVARVNSVAVAGPVEAAPEAEAAPLKGSIAVGVPPEAPASVAVPAGEVVVAAEAEEVVVEVEEAVVEEEAEGAAGKEMSSDERRVSSQRIAANFFPALPLAPRPSTLAVNS
jgi:hypothetical protein